MIRLSSISFEKMYNTSDLYFPLETRSFLSMGNIESYNSPPMVMETRTLPVACTIAGSDSGGGAGIQADLKTFAALGVWGLSVLTAVTAQNTREVKGIHLVPPQMVRLQLEAVIEDFSIRAFKTGMLGSGDQVEAVMEALPAEAILVVDPVMISTSGFPLLDARGVERVKTLLLPRTTVVTPNIPEACLLADMPEITSMDDARRAASKIQALGPEYVIIKGGHMEGNLSSDLLVGHGTKPCSLHLVLPARCMDRDAVSQPRLPRILPWDAMLKVPSGRPRSS